MSSPEIPTHVRVRRSGIRYWERRRIIYNVAIALPGVFSFLLVDNLAWVGDPHKIHYSYVLGLFALSAVGANICYTFAYALEFIFGGDDPNSRWLRHGRTTAFVAGVVFAMFLALIGGRNIAMLHYYHGIRFEFPH